MMQRSSIHGYLNSLPRTKEECGICFHARKEGPNPEHGLRLTCGHVFGNQCLSDWFKSEAKTQPRASCPLCRIRLFEHGLFRQIQRQLFSPLSTILLVFLVSTVVTIMTCLKVYQSPWNLWRLLVLAVMTLMYIDFLGAVINIWRPRHV